MGERSYDERPSAPPQTPPSGVQNRREHVSTSVRPWLSIIGLKPLRVPVSPCTGASLAPTRKLRIPVLSCNNTRRWTTC